MRALVIYESMYGNTRAIAESIADGLRARFEATVVPVSDATSDLVDTADLLIVGGPTHMHRMTTAASRRASATAAAKPDSGLTMEPKAGGPGVRDWLETLPSGDGRRLAAAFDTRLDGPPLFTGQAGQGIARQLRRHGYSLVDSHGSFLVDKRNKLKEGEKSQARQWGATVGGLAGLELAGREQEAR